MSLFQYLKGIYFDLYLHLDLLKRIEKVRISILYIYSYQLLS